MDGMAANGDGLAEGMAMHPLLGQPTVAGALMLAHRGACRARAEAATLRRPNCTRAVSALAHFIEDEGIATTGISLVREHTAGYRPPRFLWVPFPLGRPFGAPHAPRFQRRVLLAALALLERAHGPVILEDFPDDAPAPQAAAPADAADLVCPVSFPAAPTHADDPGAALAAEVASLAPWYAFAGVSKACQERSGGWVGALRPSMPACDAFQRSRHCGNCAPFSGGEMK
jgi:hypothetical protein